MQADKYAAPADGTIPTRRKRDSAMPAPDEAVRNSGRKEDSYSSFGWLTRR